MKRTLILCAIGAPIAALGGTANADSTTLLDTIVVSTGGETAWSTFTPIEGETYILEASGTFHVGGPGDQTADAQYADFSNPPESLIDIVPAMSVNIGIMVDGESPDWGAYDGDHVYQQEYVGKGTAISFMYMDSFYGDNEGELTVNVMQVVPAPAGMALLLGGGVVATRRRR